MLEWFISFQYTPVITTLLWFSCYCCDMWSTARFGFDRVMRHETNPILRFLLCSTGMMLPAFLLHTILYGGIIMVLAIPLHFVTGQTIPVIIMILTLGLAVGHLWGMTSNLRIYKEVM